MIPWLRFFASSGARELSAVIERSRPEDWKLGRHYATCAPLNLKVWHSNQGYGFEVFLGVGDDAPRVINGGPDGELAWHAFKHVRARLMKMWAHGQLRPASASASEE